MKKNQSIKSYPYANEKEENEKRIKWLLNHSVPSGREKIEEALLHIRTEGLMLIYNSVKNKNQKDGILLSDFSRKKSIYEITYNDGETEIVK